MLYGLLLEGANVEPQAPATVQTNRAPTDDEESCWLGMEAWVCCECAQTQTNA